MARYAIKHKPSNKYLYEDDELGALLVDASEGIYSVGDKAKADLQLSELHEMLEFIETDEGDFPITEFEVAELK